MKYFQLSLLSLSFLLFFQPKLHATHIVGGELSYECLGNDRYRITATMYRDGFDNFQFLDSFLVAITDPVTNTILFSTHIHFKSMSIVPQNDLSLCVVDAPDVITEKHIFERVVTLPVNDNGYIVYLQLCCRNLTVLNVINPREVGSTYFIEITKKALEECNNSPVSFLDPPILICANFSLKHDGKAIDNEGDQIKYSLCPALAAPELKSTCDYFFHPLCPDAKLDTPPFDVVPYQSGFSAEFPLGMTSEPIAINENSGLITGIPESLGQYGVSICVEEFRNGVKMSAYNRDFQLNVADCVVQELIVPTAFSPNGDGLNDQYNVSAPGFETYDLRIFDRWGKKVFESIDPNETWDGTFEGKVLSSDVFTYVLKLDCEGEDKDFKQTGNITLLK